MPAASSYSDYFNELIRVNDLLPCHNEYLNESRRKVRHWKMRPKSSQQPVCCSRCAPTARMSFSVERGLGHTTMIYNRWTRVAPHLRPRTRASWSVAWRQL